jgi:nucleotide-binding universal stress UspA family protein
VPGDGAACAVVRSATYLTPGRAEQIEAQLRDSLEEARSALQRFVSTTVEDDSLAIRVEEGDPREAILRVARSIGSGLIIMGTHGRTGIRRLTLGSVAEQVVHTSSVPVLTIRLTDHANSISKIVCAVNDSEVSRKALMYAAKLAQCLGARLTVIHVFEGENQRSISDLCAWIAQRDRPDCEIQEVTRPGHAAEEIIRLVGELDAGLLVIGAEHKLFLDKTVIGTTATHLVRPGPCAVLTVMGGTTQDAIQGHVDQAA